MEIKIKSKQSLPDWCLDEKLTLTGEGEYNAHQYGYCIGRIVKEEKISAFKKDKENGNTNLLDKTIIELETITKNKLISKKNGEFESVEMVYLPYIVEGHSSYTPTVTDAYVNNCSNVKYIVSYEVGFTAEDDFTKYVVFNYKTQGSFSTSPFDKFLNLESNLEDFFEEGEEGFWIDDGEKYAWFYDDIGDKVDININSIRELLSMIFSIRVIKVEAKIV